MSELIIKIPSRKNVKPGFKFGFLIRATDEENLSGKCDTRNNSDKLYTNTEINNDTIPILHINN